MKVKICGLQTSTHVSVAVAAGADYLGFVFAESRRRVTSRQVREITTRVPKEVQKVGVFVSPTKQEVERIITKANLDLIQIHGKQPDVAFSVPVIHAYGVDGRQQQKQPVQFPPKFLLFDAPPSSYEGGNGQPFDWQKLQLSSEEQQRCFIAGGLTSENVQSARRQFHPYGVDVSSGVESDGQKDSKKIVMFIKKAKEELDV